MSEANGATGATEKPQLPSVKEALDATAGPWLDGLFQAIADRGYPIGSESDQQELFKIAMNLRDAEEIEATTKASQAGTFYQKAAALLDDQLEKAGRQRLSGIPAGIAASAKAYAKEAAQNAHLYNSVLAIKRAQLDQMKGVA